MSCTGYGVPDLLQIKEGKLPGLFKLLSGGKGYHSQVCLADGKSNFDVKPALQATEITEDPPCFICTVTGPEKSGINNVAV
jgi:hypothetical protein